MDKKITLTPGELYFLGDLLQAKYIDYAYVAAMDDIKGRRSIYESEARSSLTSSQVIDEDFSGNLEISPFAASLLRPVFFGEFEACIDIIVLNDNAHVGTHRFHFLDGAVTMVHNEKKMLVIEAADQNEIRKIAASLVPEGYAVEKAEYGEELDTEKLTRIISVKNTKIGVSSESKTIYEIDGVLYHESADSRPESMTADMFVDEVLAVIKEV